MRNDLSSVDIHKCEEKFLSHLSRVSVTNKRFEKETLSSACKNSLSSADTWEEVQQLIKFSSTEMYNITYSTDRSKNVTKQMIHFSVVRFSMRNFINCSVSKVEKFAFYSVARLLLDSHSVRLTIGKNVVKEENRTSM